MVRLKIWVRNVANPADWRPTEHFAKGPTLELVIRDLQAKYRMPEMEYVAIEQGQEPIPTEQV